MGYTFSELLLRTPFDYTAAKAYVHDVTWPAFWISMAYIVVIFGLKFLMRNREPFKLEGLLNFWNGWLAFFSIGGCLVTTPALWHEIQKYGLSASYCKIGDFFEGTSGLWAWLFVLSKVAELGDTILIVLRKRPLMFLHWYHHVLTLNYAMLSYKEDTAFNSWIVWLNFSVHAIMYSYYLLRSMHIKIPASIAQCITVLQILQFVITHLVLFHVGLLYLQGTTCSVTPHTYWLCLGMEISYLALFGNFFYHSYIRGGGKKFVAEKKQAKVE
uniref:Elongation of very long chain fatty acids protein n=1 Tax=Plectus sambesii TaxID=2011161 RepID=A0A914X3R1_9BILA